MPLPFSKEHQCCIFCWIRWLQVCTTFNTCSGNCPVSSARNSTSLVQIQALSFSTSERLCGTANGSIPAPAAAKPAGQANGRPPASQQWQSPQTSPGPPPNKPMPQDIPATPETIKMSSEFKVQPCTKAPLLHRQSLLAWHVMVLHACYTV